MDARNAVRVVVVEATVEIERSDGRFVADENGFRLAHRLAC